MTIKPDPPRAVTWIGELISQDTGKVAVRVILDDVESARLAHKAGWRVLRYTLPDPSICEVLSIGERFGAARERVRRRRWPQPWRSRGSWGG
jgi:hypothetical protein